MDERDGAFARDVDAEVEEYVDELGGGATHAQGKGEEEDEDPEECGDLEEEAEEEGPHSCQKREKWKGGGRKKKKGGGTYAPILSSHIATTPCPQPAAGSRASAAFLLLLCRVISIRPKRKALRLASAAADSGE